MRQPEAPNLGGFKPAHQQRWNIVGGFLVAMSDPSARKELKGWCALSLSSLGLAGVFALLLAMSRVPNMQDIFPWPLQFFEKGLVIHVVFSFVVWFLSLLGGLLAIATYRVSDARPRLRGIGPLSIWLAVIAFGFLFVPGLMDRGEPSLNNYIPVIIDPLYYVGLATFALSITLQALRFMANLPSHEGPFDPVSQGIATACVLVLAALVCFIISLNIRWGTPVDGSFNEDVFWAAGHTLQFLNTLLMLIGWYVLGGVMISRPLIDPRLFKALLVLFIVSAFALVSLSILFDPTSYDGRAAYTWAQYGLAPPTLIFAGAACVNLWIYRSQTGRFDFKNPAALALFLSVLVFGIGGFLGLFVDGADTRTPAHYHGVIGGVNIAFFGLFFCFLFPILKAAPSSLRPVRILLWCYALGQTFHSLGLFMAGGYGAPRKTAGDAQGIEVLGAEVGLYMMGIGAIIAVIGGVMFVWIAGRILVKIKAHN